MHLDLVEDALEEFLRAEEPHIVALSGRWGRGKTYFWQQHLRRRRVAAGSGGQYCYVSLFGVPDLQALKDALFESAISMDLPETLPTRQGRLRSAYEMAQSQLSRLQYGARKYAALFERLPKIGELGPFLRSAAFLTVSGYLICIDDLERRSETLAIKDVLGLASMLREQRKCRILFILNTDALSTDDRTQFDTYREKVFDYEILFDPSPAECAAIVFSDVDYHADWAASDAIMLRIQNIRVLFRIRRLIDTIVPALRHADSDVARQVIHSAVLLGWCYNSKDEEAPPYDYVKTLSYANFMEFPSTKPVTREEKDWNAILSAYDYHSTDELDLVICDVLERGYFDVEHLRQLVAERETAIERRRLESRFHDAWQIFHGSFSDNEERLATAFEASFREAAHLISFLNASATIALLRELKRDQLADELMRHWISVQVAENPEALNLERELHRGEIQDQRFYEAARSAYSEADKELPLLTEVVSGLVENAGWSETDIQVLSSASEQEFFDLFKSLSGPRTRSLVRACVRFAEFANGPPEYTLIGNKAQAALLRIAQESELNRRRVLSCGIE